MNKPLGCKAYGSIPHLPGSRLGKGDHHISGGQAYIATVKLRDKHDRVYVTEKLDGSNCSVAKLRDGRIVALTRSGYLAETSPYLQHHLFSDWVYANVERFDALLNPGERVVGEWLAQAHGTIYDLNHEPFVVFELFRDKRRVLQKEFLQRVDERFETPRLLYLDTTGTMTTIGIEEAVKRLDNKWSYHGAIEEAEGAVWRIERDDKVDFLCKYVRHDKIDGKYLPEFSGKVMWNRGLEFYLPQKALDRLKNNEL